MNHHHRLFPNMTVKRLTQNNQHILITAILMITVLIFSFSAVADTTSKQLFDQAREAMAERQHDKAILLLEKAAAKDNPEAVTLLIRYYASPDFKNHKRALELATAQVKVADNPRRQPQTPAERDRANQFKVKAYRELAALHANGIGVAKSEVQAINLLKKIGHLNNEVAAQIGAYFYKQAQKDSKMFQEAATWLLNAIKSHKRAYLNANYLIAKHAFQNKDYQKAASASYLAATKGGATTEADLAELSKRADQGDAEAQLYKAYTYAAGLHGGKDYKKAHQYYQKAAAQNHLNAVSEYVYFLEQELKDIEGATPYRLQGARLGDSKLQLAIAKDYYSGSNGLPKNAPEAFRWINQAALNGEQPATELWLDLYSEYYTADHGIWRHYTTSNNIKHHYNPDLILGPISNFRHDNISLVLGMNKFPKTLYKSTVYPAVDDDQVRQGFDAEVIGYYFDCQSNQSMIASAVFYNKGKKIYSEINPVGLTEWKTIIQGQPLHQLSIRVCKK